MMVLKGRFQASRCCLAGCPPKRYTFMVNRFWRRFCRLRANEWINKHYTEYTERLRKDYDS
jgi:hypothetical protein